ncbi:XrtA/PEP-CTERM system histidine kinase PrsK [Massilia pseudoviolaceinigra]|uniref:XrtA/PEP-CTERM system histidine kinase PrsK n=1 Tax=Massilia pseudoviolaceinigra TaxID=3057165 RepID=UPI0027966130|nr:XrtA/PEP-CTERM system histidine kinase PrsK [Massilia sp. CCM 9206]MDQ1921909.1 PEP-CTERM system histidine kinase PrsK [Massilia sp. CCM 9206]
MLTNIATFSYSIAALAFALLGAVLLTRWRSRQHASVLASACALTVLWGAALAAQAWGALPQNWAGELLEVARNGAWTVVLLSLLGHFEGTSWRQLRRTPALPAVAALYVLVLGDKVLSEFFPAVLGQQSGILGVMARIGMAVLGMLLVEQLYRNKPVQERWAIKFACLGIGGIFVYDFYLYSNALLMRQVNPEIWSARGVVNALTAPLIAVSVARSASWSTHIAVSRRLLFHSAALFGSAAYLLAMGAAGYYLRYFGGQWGSLMQMAFLFGALVLLAGILFSGTFRSWLKVFISKHFYSYNYDYREEWLRFTRTLSEAGPNLGERTLQAVGELVESSGGMLWIRREAGQCEPVASWHLPASAPSEPDDSAFCRFLESRQWVVDLQEFAKDPDKYEGLVLPEWLNKFPRGWLVVPLMLQGRLFGFMLLLQPRSAITLNWEVIDLLKIAGSQAASYLAQHEAASALMLARQFESFNRMSTFVVHDLKNLVSQLGLLIPNAEKHKDNPEFQRDMLETVTLSVQKMRLMLQKLSRSASQERPAPLSIEKLLVQAVASKAAFEPRPLLTVAEPRLRVVADWERLERVVGHLIQNAIEATPKEGQVAITLSRADDSVIIEIRDTGEGMSEEFIRERLYKPFESTKSAGMGIGAFESREYIHELGGSLTVSSTPPEGTTFRITLPLCQQDTQTVDKAA